MINHTQDTSYRSIDLAQARARSQEGDIQACIGTLLALGGGVLGYVGLGFNSIVAEIATTTPSFAIAAGGLVMIGLGVLKIFRADGAEY